MFCLHCDIQSGSLIKMLVCTLARTKYTSGQHSVNKNITDTIVSLKTISLFAYKQQ